MTEQAVNREDKTAATESPCLAQAPTTANPRYSISSAIARHTRFEKASFHTPGHKGRQESLFQDPTQRPADLHGQIHSNLQGQFDGKTPGDPQGQIDGKIPGDPQGESRYLSSDRDLTELPGLDDLSAPTGVIADLEERAARLWESGGQAFISVNGATAGLTAAILATARRGGASDQYALVPRNAHRSVVNALCLARIKPIWYEPKFEGAWGFWGAATAPSVQLAIEEARLSNASIACAVVVSPTYSGALSDITAIAKLTKSHNIPLIVDEAHGAHFLPGRSGGNIDMPSSAIACGADAVAHSWHKTLPALTQTGALHLPKGSMIAPEAVRSSLNLVTSSSPSYLLLASMEKTLSLLESPRGNTLIHGLLDLSEQFRQGLAALSCLDLYDTKYDIGGGINPSHVVVRTGQEEAHHLYEFLQDRGIFAEATLGSGVLFMLGLGSQAADVELVLATIKDFVNAYELNAQGENFVSSPFLSAGTAQAPLKSNKFRTPPSFEPILPPHQAMFMPQETISVREALGRIAAQCLSPCPPGIPILIPGQKITEEVLELISDKTIVVVAQ